MEDTYLILWRKNNLMPPVEENLTTDTPREGNLPVPEVPKEPANDNIDMSTELGDNTSDSPQAKS